MTRVSLYILRRYSDYVAEDGDDGQTVPVIRQHGLTEAPEALLVVNKLDLHGKGDFTPRVF